MKPLDLVVYSVMPISFSLSDSKMTFCLGGLGALFLDNLMSIPWITLWKLNNFYRFLTVAVDMDVSDVDYFQNVSQNCGPLWLFSKNALFKQAIYLPHARKVCSLTNEHCSSISVGIECVPFNSACVSRRQERYPYSVIVWRWHFIKSFVYRQPKIIYRSVEFHTKILFTNWNQRKNLN